MPEIKKINEMFENMKNIELPKVTKEYDDIVKCHIHDDYVIHYVEYNDGSFVVTPKCCPKCEKERERAKKAREIAELNQQKLDSYKLSNISPEFYDKTLNDFIPKTKAQQAAVDAVKDIISGNKLKLILLGSNGAGKTMLGNIAVKMLGGKIYTMYEIATRIRQSYTADSKESELGILNELANEELLVIDEVGRLKMSEAVQDWFSYLLDKRHSYKKPFFLIGNLHFTKDCEQHGCPKCFENYFDRDILSRLKQDSTIIEIIAEDNRNAEHSCLFISDRSKK